MKPTVDLDLCIGCGNCEDVCPDVFRLDDDGLARAINEHPGPELYECTREAQDICPVGAITIEE